MSVPVYYMLPYSSAIFIFIGTPISGVIPALLRLSSTSLNTTTTSGWPLVTFYDDIGAGTPSSLLTSSAVGTVTAMLT